MGWIAAIGNAFKTIGIALGMIKRDQQMAEDFKVARGADLEAQAEQEIDAAKDHDANSALTDQQLNDKLRQAGAGHR